MQSQKIYFSKILHRSCKLGFIHKPMLNLKTLYDCENNHYSSCENDQAFFSLA